MAGYLSFRIMRSSSAACIAYRLDKIVQKERNILVFDLSSSNFNVYVVNIADGFFELKCYDTDSTFGGEYFTERMVQHFIKEFKRKYNQDVAYYRAIRRLRAACERAQIELFTSVQASIEIDSFYDGINLYTSITRMRFDHLNQDLFKYILSTVEKVLRDSNLEKRSIDEIVLVGGSTRVKKIQDMLKEFFGGKELNKSINLDEVLATGATIHGASVEELSKKKRNVQIH